MGSRGKLPLVGLGTAILLLSIIAFGVVEWRYTDLLEAAFGTSAEMVRSSRFGAARSLSVGTNVWPGYEPLYLARSLGLYGQAPIRLVEYASATQVIRAFRNGAIDVAALTLDEVLLLRESRLDARVIIRGESVPGEGSTFSFTAVFGKQDGKPAAADSAAPRPAAPEAEAERRQKRILIAEDDPINHKLLAAMIARLGHQTDLVANGRQAVERFEATPYDLILMDCEMPEMDGYQATAEIRQHEEAIGNGHVPVIAVTAHAMKGAREKCLDAGMDDYLTKPVDLEALADILERW